MILDEKKRGVKDCNFNCLMGLRKTSACFGFEKETEKEVQSRRNMRRESVLL